MTRHILNRVVRLTIIAAILLAAAVSRPDDGGPLQRVAGGIEIYLGVVPAEMVGGHPREHPERRMHGGTNTGGYHVMVALFDHATGARITDAQVSARLGPPSQPGPVTRLEPMTIAGASTYGNYFDMVRGGSYRIDVEIRRPGSPGAVNATFQWAAQ